MAKDVMDRTLALLQKRFGTTSAVRLGRGKHAEAQVTEALPTRVEVVDHYLLGLGGFALGRMSEWIGENQCGKTSLAYQSIAACQQAGGTAYMMDAEHSFDETRAATFGVDVDNLIILQPEHAEMGVEQTKVVLDAHNPKAGPLLVVWDTLAAMVCKADLKRPAGERGTAELPRLLSTELPKIVPVLADKRAHLMALNQIRAAIGVMFGPDTVTPGGNAVKFYASTRVQFFGGKAVKHPTTDAHTGKVVTMLTIKTRFSEPFRKARVRLDYATGWNNEWSTLEHAKTLKLVQARGPKGGARKGPQALAEARSKLGWGSAAPATSAPPGGAATPDSEE